MKQYLSDKIKIMSFLAILVVLFIHAGLPNTLYPDGLMQIAYVIREIIARIIGDNAVPLFYVISGYLFFRHVYTITDVLEKMKRRARSLLVPFMIACFHVPLFYLVIETIPEASNYINAEPFWGNVVKLSFKEIILSLFYDSGNTFPWAVHLWFLRDLIIIVVCAPVLYLLVNKIGVFTLVVVTILYFLFPNVYFLYGMIWFMMGHFYLDKFSSYKFKYIPIIPILWLVISVCHSLSPEFGCWRFLKLIEITLGIITFWNLYDVVVPESFSIESCKWLKIACGFTFFIYLYHDPEYHIIIKGIPILIGQNGMGYLLSFLLSPLIQVVLMIAVGTILKRYMCKMYFILTGGR